MVSRGRDGESRQTLREDERAIEGLPIRLVIALFVGVASLFLMLQVLDLFDTSDLDRSEITVELDEGSTVDVANTSLSPTDTVLQFQVVGGDGSVVDRENYDNVLFTPDTAQGETETASNGTSGVTYNSDNGTYAVTFEYIESVLNARLAAGQATGTYEIEPQGATEFDEAEPVEITIID